MARMDQTGVVESFDLASCVFLDGSCYGLGILGICT